MGTQIVLAVHEMNSSKCVFGVTLNKLDRIKPVMTVGDRQFIHCKLIQIYQQTSLCFIYFIKNLYDEGLGELYQRCDTNIILIVQCKQSLSIPLHNTWGRCDEQNPHFWLKKKSIITKNKQDNYKKMQIPLFTLHNRYSLQHRHVHNDFITIRQGASNLGWANFARR